MATQTHETEPENYVFTGNEKEKATGITMCPSCGGNMLFDPEKQLLKCEFCGTEKEFRINHNEELDFEKLFEYNAHWTDDTHVFSCSNCGAKVVISKHEISKNCPFCGTSNVVETTELSGMKPNAIVPFHITKEKASENAIAWAKGKLLASRRFKKHLTYSDELSGIYNPAFTFDTDTCSSYSGRLGRKIVYTTRENGRTVTHTRIEYFHISGVYSQFFDDVLIQASSQINQKTIDKLQPFETNDSKEYSDDFLHGYSASQYTRDGKECWGNAKQIINKRIRSGILSRYTYDVVDSLNINTEFNSIKYKYILLPVYVGCFRWSKKADRKSKVYNFFVNGFNGKVHGKVPLSPLKIGILTVLAAGAVALLGWLGFKFFF